jgi:ribonuclease BN (tRNA processing enzyme)
VVVELTVLGCSGSYGAPAGGACSAYLVRAGDQTIWMDCGNGSFANLQQHADPSDLTAVVITHGHPDHCVDLYGLHVMYRYGLERGGLPVYASEGVEKTLEVLVGSFGETFDWHTVLDGDHVDLGDASLRFSRTDHPPPTVAVEIAHDGKRLVYTADTGPAWSVDAFGPGADLVLSEATYLHDDIRTNLHVSARQAGELARDAKARRLMITHLWPTIDPLASVEEASEAFGREVTLAAPHLSTHV